MILQECLEESLAAPMPAGKFQQGLRSRPNLIPPGLLSTHLPLNSREEGALVSNTGRPGAEDLSLASHGGAYAIKTIA